MIMSEVLTFHTIKTNKCHSPGTITLFAEGLWVEIGRHFLPFFYLDAWGEQLPISPDTQIGWELNYGLHLRREVKLVYQNT